MRWGGVNQLMVLIRVNVSTFEISNKKHMLYKKKKTHVIRKEKKTPLTRGVFFLFVHVFVDNNTHSFPTL